MARSRSATGSDATVATPAAATPRQPGSRQRFRTTVTFCISRGAARSWNASATAFTTRLYRAKNGASDARSTWWLTMLLKMKSMPIATTGPRMVSIRRRFRYGSAQTWRSVGASSGSRRRRGRLDGSGLGGQDRGERRDGEQRSGKPEEIARRGDGERAARQRRSHGRAQHAAGRHQRIGALRLGHVHLGSELDPELAHHDRCQDAGPDVERHQGCRHLGLDGFPQQRRPDRAHRQHDRERRGGRSGPRAGAPPPARPGTRARRCRGTPTAAGSPADRRGTTSRAPSRARCAPPRW